MSTTIEQSEGPRALPVGPRTGTGTPSVREGRRGWILARLCLAQPS